MKCLPAAWLSLAISESDLMLHFACLIQDKTAEDWFGKAYRVGIAQLTESDNFPKMLCTMKDGSIQMYYILQIKNRTLLSEE